MNTNKIKLTRGITAIFWLGFFMAISFMEAPLKFTAPGLSMAEGLQIGKIIFGTLNKCEWIFLMVILITCFIKTTSRAGLYLIVAIAFIMVLETAWLLPVLNIGADKIIHGQKFNHGQLHWVYVLLEIIKAPVLLLIGLESLRSVKEPAHIIQ
jgi:hypothetical protein